MANDTKSDLTAPLTLDLEKAKEGVFEVPARATEDPAIRERAHELALILAGTNPEDEKGKVLAREAVEGMGKTLQSEAARRSVMLKAPVRTIAAAGEDGGPVARSLVDLKLEVERLDPAKFDLSPGWFSRALGFLPFVGNPIRRYFTQFESAQTVIDAIIESLKKGRDQLKRDNTTLSDDRVAMIELSGKIARQVRLGEALDAEIVVILDKSVPAGDARRAFVEQEVLFPLRQRVIDLQTQLAVNQQGALAISVITQNNRELVRGVDRALDVTVSALQVAVTVALALANQKIVLDKISALKGATETLIAGTAERLKTQGAEIHRKATEPALQTEVLKKAFADIKAAIEDIAKYRREALPKMAGTILEFDRLTADAEQKIAEVGSGEQARARLSLDVQ